MTRDERWETLERYLRMGLAESYRTACAVLRSLEADYERMRLEHEGGDEYHKGCARELAFAMEVAGMWKAEAARLRTERDALAEALRTIGSDYCTHERCNSREHRKARAALSRLEDPGQGRG